MEIRITKGTDFNISGKQKYIMVSLGSNSSASDKYDTTHALQNIYLYRNNTLQLVIITYVS